MVPPLAREVDFLYLCHVLEGTWRVKAAAQQNSIKLGSAFALHFTCQLEKHPEIKLSKLF